MSNIKLYSAWYCPFAQRAWMALLHKNIDFEYIETDPYDKTAEWLEISLGQGTVPVVVDENNEVTVPDSIRTLEYIEAQFPEGPSLFPELNGEVADNKYWIDYLGQEIIPYFYRFLKAPVGTKAARDAEHHLINGLKTFTAQMDGQGPYFNGKEPGAIDIALAPFALRLEILLAHYKGYELPDANAGITWARYHKWWQAMKSFEPFVKTSIGIEGFEERIIEFYEPYSTGGGQQNVTQIKIAV